MITTIFQALAASLLVMSTPAMAASVCVDFVNFCDGLELTITDRAWITGTWQAYNCSPGSDAEVDGSVKNGEAKVICGGPLGCDVSRYFSPNFDFVFLLDPVRQTFDLYGRDAGGNIIIFGVGEPFTLVGFPCPFANDRTGVSSVGLKL